MWVATFARFRRVFTASLVIVYTITPLFMACGYYAKLLFQDRVATEDKVLRRLSERDPGSIAQCDLKKTHGRLKKRERHNRFMISRAVPCFSVRIQRFLERRPVIGCSWGHADRAGINEYCVCNGSGRSYVFPVAQKQRISNINISR